MASPFSFHCMICFEEFDVETRFPVVLPCGHTYVCNECAKRLDKCMECRTPLIELIPNSSNHQCTNASGQQQQHHQQQQQQSGWSTRNLGSSNNSRGGAVGRGGGPMNKKPAPPLKRRIPLPKNVVLMSLIEATELATKNVQGREHEPSLQDSPLINHSVLDMEEDEEEKIKTGTSLAISDCGTYAVAAKDGLEIFPNRPESLLQHSEEDVDTLVRVYNNKESATASTSTSINSTVGGVVDDDKKTAEDELQLPRKEPPPGRLSWGDRVQIVSTQNGWAKMARGYGYVRAGVQQLVKGM